MKRFLPGFAGGLLASLLVTAGPALASLAIEGFTGVSITSASGLSGEGTASSPLACTAATASAAGCVSTSAQTFGGNKTILGADGQNPNSKLLTVSNPDGGVALATHDTEGMFTVHGTDGAAEATPLIYFYSSTASPYHALKMGSGADPNSNWHWTWGSSGTVPYFRSRANGLALDLAGGGDLYPATDSASDLGSAANKWLAVHNVNQTITGTATHSLASGDAMTVVAGGYARFTFNAGAPTATDCDAAGESGRIAIDTTNNRFYFCNGAAWQYTNEDVP